MAPIRLGIHLAPQANPQTVIGLVSKLIEEQLSFNTSKALIDHMEDWSLPARSEIPAMAAELGLVRRDSDEVTFSEEGAAFFQLREDSKADVLHFLVFTRWSELQPFDVLQSWGYRKICDLFWTTGNVALGGAYLDRLVEEIINEAREYFSGLTPEGIEEISFSRKSIRGVMNWLEALTPPVIEGDTFSRRYFCPPELLVLALGHVYSDDPEIVGSDVLLSQARRDALCRLCLLEPDALDRTLDWALGAHPHLIEQGTTAGMYGRFLRFRKLPTLMDLIP